MKPSLRNGFAFSITIHVVFFAMLFLGTLSWVRPEPETVFTLVSPPAPTEAREENSPMMEEPVEELSLPEFGEIVPPQEVEIAPEPPPPERISAEEFFRENPRRETRRVIVRPERRAVRFEEIDPSQLVRELERNLTDSEALARARNLSTYEQNALRNYIRSVEAAIDRVWVEPNSLGVENFEARVRYRVESDGGITGVEIVRIRGDAAFRQSILEAFRSVGKVNPPPDREPLNLVLTFRVVR